MKAKNSYVTFECQWAACAFGISEKDAEEVNITTCPECGKKLMRVVWTQDSITKEEIEETKDDYFFETLEEERESMVCGIPGATAFDYLQGMYGYNSLN